MAQVEVLEKSFINGAIREAGEIVEYDGDIDELHAFAAKLGLRRGWFQPHHILPHYDLTPARRVKAVALGATEVSMREYLRRNRDDAMRKAGRRS